MSVVSNTGRRESSSACSTAFASKGYENVPQGERCMSVIAGGALLATALSRGSISSLLVAIVGGSLLYRGVTGHCGVYQMIEDAACDSGSVARPRVSS